MSKRNFLSRIAPLGVFLMICVFLAIGLTKDPRALPTTMIDRGVPKFDLTELNNEDESITHMDLFGRITVLNVFGSWCPECLVEHPTFMRLQNQRSFDLVGLNWRDTRVDARKWLNRYGDPYEYVLFDAESQLAIELGVTGAPETFIIGPKGRIRYKHVGAVTYSLYTSKIAPVIAMLQDEVVQ